MIRRGNKPVGTVARVIMLMIVGVSIVIAAVAIYATQRTNTPVRGSQALPAQVAEQLGQAKPPAGKPQ